MTEWWWNERNNHLRPKKEGGPALASFRSERKREVYPPIPLCRGGWVDWLHACIEMNDQGMKEWEGNVRDESGMGIEKEALSLSAHPPLQRGMVGLTPRLYWDGWSRNEGMSREWKEWVRDGNPKGSVESIHPSPSAEGDGRIDFTLVLRWMIKEWRNEQGM